MRRSAARIGLGIAAVFGAAPLVAPARAAEDVVLDRLALDAGRVLTVSLSEAHLSVRFDGPSGVRLEAQPVAQLLLLPGFRVVAAKAAPRGEDGAVLAVVVAQGPGNGHGYHWVETRGGKDGKWRVGEITSDAGEPMRILDVRAMGDDGLEITFRKGRPDPRSAGPSFQDLVYARAGGAERLFSLRPVALEAEDVPPPDVADLVDDDLPVTEVPSGEPPTEAEPNPPVLARLRLQADGTVTFDSPGGASGGPPAVARLAGEPAAQADALKALEAAMARAASRPDLRHADGTSKIRLAVVADPAASWRWVQWSLMAAASPAVKIFRVRFGEGADAVDLEVGRDRGTHDEFERGRLSVSLDRQPAEGAAPRTRVRVEGTRAEWFVESGPGRAASLDALAAAVRRQVRAGVVATVLAPHVAGPDVPYADATDVIRALRKAGADEVSLGGTALPGPRARPR